MLKYLITGTGRCGTAYLARLLTQAGVPCDHEQVFAVDGLHEDRHTPGGASSSWLALPYLEQTELIGPETVLIHVMRHPKDFIESVLRKGILADDAPDKYTPYRDFVQEHALSITLSQLDRAAQFWLDWNRRIEEKYGLFSEVVPWKIEYPPEGLLAVLDLDQSNSTVEDRWRNRAEWFVEGTLPYQVTLKDIGGEWLRNRVIEVCAEYGYSSIRGETPNVYWSVLLERNISHYAVASILGLAEESGRREYTRLAVPYGRTDYVRNEIVRRFIRQSTCSDDVLIMLDNDHLFPTNTLSVLAAHDKPVVAALAFRRSRPFDPQFYRDVDGRLVNPADWEAGALYEADAVGMGAIAIKRWVFTELEKQGQHFPFFRYQYTAGPMSYRTTEDIFFSYSCGKAGIKMYCDTSVEIPHQAAKFVDHRTWEKFKRENPGVVKESEMPAESQKGAVG